MTVDRDDDLEATVKQPQVFADPIAELEDIDPEKTLVREDWESTVIRRVAPHVAAVQSAIGEDSAAEGRFGWESEGLRRLAQELQRAGK
jgi:diaminopimelate decarboxylase